MFWIRGDLYKLTCNWKMIVVHCSILAVFLGARW